MSASREKKKRFEERSEGTEKRQVRAKDTQKTQKRKKLITAIVAVVIVVLLVVAVVFNSNLFYTGVAAVRVGSEKYTAADFNYEYFNNYYNTYSNLYNTYGSYVSMFLDTNTPLKDQMYSDTQTWDEYFEEQAFDQLQQITILNDMADADGFTLDAAQLAEINQNIEDIKTSAANAGYTDYRAYIRAMYGKGITEDRLRTLLEKSYRATYYSRNLGDRWMAEYTEEAMADYYDTVRDDYDLISYMYYFVDGSADEESGLDADTALAQAYDIAQEIASARDQVTFADAVYRYAPEDQKASYEDEDACLRRLVSAGSISALYKDWLTDAGRISGDTTVIEGTGGYYVILFLERNGNDYRLANFRGITIAVGVDETTGEVTQETRDAAQELVDSIIEAYNEDPTEENFALLADRYDESGDNLEGGLMENVIMGQLSSLEVEDYVFDDATQVGDVQTVYEDGFYYITYPMERGEKYDLFIAKNLMVEEQYNTAIESAREDYPVSTTFAFHFTK